MATQLRFPVMPPRPYVIPATVILGAVVALGTWPSAKPSTFGGCRGDRSYCDSLEAAIDALAASPDSVCRLLGEQAAKRFADPHAWYARFEGNGNGFVRIDEPAHDHADAPTVDGVNYAESGPSLAGRIARHEAYGLQRVDSVQVAERCR